MNVKSGYKTSEFWITVVTSLFGALVLAGVLTQEEATEWMAIFAPVLLLIVPQVFYVVSRAKVKSG